MKQESDVGQTGKDQSLPEGRIHFSVPQVELERIRVESDMFMEIKLGKSPQMLSIFSMEMQIITKMRNPFHLSDWQRGKEIK